MTFGGGLKSAMESHLMGAIIRSSAGSGPADQLPVVGQVNVIGYWKWMYIAPLWKDLSIGMGILTNEAQAMGGSKILSIVHLPTMLQQLHCNKTLYKVTIYI